MSHLSLGCLSRRFPATAVAYYRQLLCDAGGTTVRQAFGTGSGQLAGIETGVSEKPAYCQFFDRLNAGHFSAMVGSGQAAPGALGTGHLPSSSGRLHDQYLSAYLTLDPDMRQTHFHADTEGLNLATLKAMQIVDQANGATLTDSVRCFVRS